MDKNTDSKDSDTKEMSLHETIHINQAIERHLSQLLDQATTTDKKPLLEDVNTLLQQIQSSSNYAELVEALAHGKNIPPPRIMQKKKQKQPASFSLFDLLASSSTGGPSSFSGSTGGPKLPANIRDVLQCSSDLDFLQKCNESLVQDLILGFNTTQGEVLSLANRLHRCLSMEFLVEKTPEVDDGNGVQDHEEPLSFLGLHSNWVKECVKDEETISFAFLLVRNVILISCSDGTAITDTAVDTDSNNSANFDHTCRTISVKQRLEIVKALKEMMECLMDSWNDTGSFQQSWLEIVYMWFRCSFTLTQKGNEHGYGNVHLAWALIDTKGTLFENCFKCISSTLKIRILVIKSGLVEYLMTVLSGGSCHIPSADGSVLFHSLSLLKTIVLHSSVWTFPYPDSTSAKGANLEQTRTDPTLDTLNDEFQWIQDIDDELKILSAENIKSPSQREIQYLLAPFTSLLEIALCQKDIELDENGPKLSHTKSINLGKDLVHPYLIDICAQCITHILCSCARDKDLFTNGAMNSLLSVMKNMPKSYHTRSTLPAAVVACYIIITKVTDYGMWQNAMWARWVGKVVSVELPILIQFLPRSKGARPFDPWNLVMGVLVPILKHHDAFSEELPISMLRSIMSNYATSVVSSNTGCKDDLAAFIRMISSSTNGRIILESMQSQSTLDKCRPKIK